MELDLITITIAASSILVGWFKPQFAVHLFRLNMADAFVTFIDLENSII